MAEPRVTQEELAEYKQVDEERLELDRRSALLKRQLEPTKKKLVELVETAGGTDRTCVRYGFILSLRPGAKYPNWQGAYIAELGVDAAQKVKADATPTQILSVEPVA